MLEYYETKYSIDRKQANVKTKKKISIYFTQENE